MSFYPAAAPLWMIKCDKMFDSVPLWVKSGGRKGSRRERKWPALTHILKVLGNLDSIRNPDSRMEPSASTQRGYNPIPVNPSKASTTSRDFQGSPVVKTPHVHCRRFGFDPSSRVAWAKKKKNNKKDLLSSTSRENQTTSTPSLLQSWYTGMTWIPTSSYLRQDWAIATWTPRVSPF